MGIKCKFSRPRFFLRICKNVAEPHTTKRPTGKKQQKRNHNRPSPRLVAQVADVSKLRDLAPSSQVRLHGVNHNLPSPTAVAVCTPPFQTDANRIKLVIIDIIKRCFCCLVFSP